jgi:hypothetical protein
MHFKAEKGWFGLSGSKCVKPLLNLGHDATQAHWVTPLTFGFCMYLKLLQ